ncbi:hypothetical protein ACTZWW_04350 [Salinarimonas sp. NSM]|uniref:hypothetical protein n=1 Tax=Salinarimonas sp. NSM TaxID=3458003 RepID=UPI004036B053
MFRIGQLVVCILDHPTWGWPEAMARPRKDDVYTVRDVEFFDADPDTGFSEVVLHREDGSACVPMILVEELENDTVSTACGFVGEPSWVAVYFRPAVRTDISLIRNLLAPVDDRALEPA